MAASMSLGKFYLGASLFTVSINWALEYSAIPTWYKLKFPGPAFRQFGKEILEGNILPKWRLLRARPSITVLLSIFIIHLIGISWSPDSQEAWKDLKIKIGIFLIPLCIGTSRPLEKKTFETLLLFFVTAVFISCVSTLLVAKGIVIPKKPITDLREASIFVPLIRLSLMVVLSIFFLGRWMIRIKNILLKFSALALMCGYMWFLTYMQSLTGLVILFTGGFFLLVIMAFVHKKRKLILALLTCFIVFSLGAGFVIKKAYDDFYTMQPTDMGHLDHFTSRGNSYFSEFNYPMLENGNQVMTYVCWHELDSCWTKRSKIKLDSGLDVNGNPVAITLLRYLASKGWRKDADAMAKLTDAEIHAIENGATNAKDPERSSIERRIYQVFWEIYHYQHGSNPSGNSVTMRLELLQTAMTSIRHHPLIGVGTGGQQKAFAEIYEKQGTVLDENFQWLHSHNQLLSIGVTLGIPVLLYFLFSLWYAPHSMKRWRSYLYLAFFMVFFLSFFDDDTLETSQGVFFYAFFNSLFLYAMPRGSAVEKGMESEGQAISETKP